MRPCASAAGRGWPPCSSASPEAWSLVGLCTADGIFTTRPALTLRIGRSVVDRLRMIVDQAVGVQVQVPASRGPLVHPPNDQLRGVQHRLPRTDVGRVLIEVPSPASTAALCASHTCRATPGIAVRPQQRHRLRRETCNPTRPPTRARPFGDLMLGHSPVVWVADPRGRQQGLGLGGLGKTEPAAEVTAPRPGRPWRPGG